MEDRAAQDLDAIRAVLGGETRPFEVLVTRYQRMVAGVAWRHGISAAEIDDVVSDVFLKTYQNLHRYRPDHPFSTWLYRLALNHTVDRLRRAKKERGRTELPEQLADPTADAQRGIETDERARLLRAALNDLPSHYREVMQLVYVEGLKVDATADALGIPSGTVKTRLMRGRDALRKILVGRHPAHFGS